MRERSAGDGVREGEHAHLRAVVNSVDDAVLVLDSDGMPLVTSRAYDELFGAGEALVAEDFSGRSLAPEMWPDRRAARGETFSMSFTVGSGGGTERRTYEAKGRAVLTDGRRHGAVVVIRDVTGRSDMPLQDEFMAIASHELRTPLTVLLGYLEMLQRRLPEDDTTSRRYTARALSQTKRLADLISNLLDVTRLQHGKMQLDLEPVELGRVIHHTVEVARPLSEGQEILFEAPTETLVVSADPGRLEQVVMNLLTNAIKYAPQTERIVVRLDRRASEAVLQVIDTGPGIAAADLPNLFTRFYQVEAMRPRGAGLGLGLFISNQIVQAHGGTIEVESVEGAGSTFSVRLPIVS